MSTAEIHFTDIAATRMREALEEENEVGRYVRIRARRVGVRKTRYGMDVIDPEVAPGDTVVTAGEVTVVLDEESAAWLRGATVDYVESENGGPSGFKFDNPQERPRWDDPVAARIQQLLDEEVNPGIAAHHGFIELVSYEDGVARVHMGGGCHGCGLAGATLSDGVATRLIEAIPELREVRDTTDHATGENPFYLPR